MATSLTILLLVSLTISSSTPISAKTNTTTIETTCKNTIHYEYCVSVLESDPRSFSADAKGLAAIMIGVGMTYANATATYLAENLTSQPVLKMIYKDCSDTYASAADSLRQAIQYLEEPNFDYGYDDVLAAYPGDCRISFLLKGLSYPMEMYRREMSLSRICDVVCGILNMLF